MEKSNIHEKEGQGKSGSSLADIHKGNQNTDLKDWGRFRISRYLLVESKLQFMHTIFATSEYVANMKKTV